MASSGLNYFIDPGMPTRLFQDYIQSFPHLINAVKFGWATSLATPDIVAKINTLNSANIPFWFGGSLFELAYQNNQFDDWLAWIERFNCKYVEISDGIINIPHEEKLRIISLLSKKYSVLSEVGSKDVNKVTSPRQWIFFVKQELLTGATRVILEGRESGKAGIYRTNGELRRGLLQEISEAGVPIDSLIYEAPLKFQQVELLKTVGPGVNLSNLRLQDAVNIYTLRYGLRNDTVELQEKVTDIFEFNREFFQEPV